MKRKLTILFSVAGEQVGRIPHTSELQQTGFENIGRQMLERAGFLAEQYMMGVMDADTIHNSRFGCDYLNAICAVLRDALHRGGGQLNPGQQAFYDEVVATLGAGKGLKNNLNVQQMPYKEAKEMDERAKELLTNLSTVEAKTNETNVEASEEVSLPLLLYKLRDPIPFIDIKATKEGSDVLKSSVSVGELLALRKELLQKDPRSEILGDIKDRLIGLNPNSKIVFTRSRDNSDVQLKAFEKAFKLATNALRDDSIYLPDSSPVEKAPKTKGWLQERMANLGDTINQIKQTIFAKKSVAQEVQNPNSTNLLKQVKKTRAYKALSQLGLVLFQNVVMPASMVLATPSYQPNIQQGTPVEQVNLKVGDQIQEGGIRLVAPNGATEETVIGDKEGRATAKTIAVVDNLKQQKSTNLFSQAGQILGFGKMAVASDQIPAGATFYGEAPVKTELTSDTTPSRANEYTPEAFSESAPQSEQIIESTPEEVALAQVPQPEPVAEAQEAPQPIAQDTTSPEPTTTGVGGGAGGGDQVPQTITPWDSSAVQQTTPVINPNTQVGITPAKIDLNGTNQQSTTPVQEAGRQDARPVASEAVRSGTPDLETSISENSTDVGFINSYLQESQALLEKLKKLRSEPVDLPDSIRNPDDYRESRLQWLNKAIEEQEALAKRIARVAEDARSNPQILPTSEDGAFQMRDAPVGRWDDDYGYQNSLRTTGKLPPVNWFPDAHERIRHQSEAIESQVGDIGFVPITAIAHLLGEDGRVVVKRYDLPETRVQPAAGVILGIRLSDAVNQGELDRFLSVQFVPGNIGGQAQVQQTPAQAQPANTAPTSATQVNPAGRFNPGADLSVSDTVRIPDSRFQPTPQVLGSANAPSQSLFEIEGKIRRAAEQSGGKPTSITVGNQTFSIVGGTDRKRKIDPAVSARFIEEQLRRQASQIGVTNSDNALNTVRQRTPQQVQRQTPGPFTRGQNVSLEWGATGGIAYSTKEIPQETTVRIEDSFKTAVVEGKQVQVGFIKNPKGNGEILVINQNGKWVQIDGLTPEVGSTVSLKLSDGSSVTLNDLVNNGVDIKSVISRLPTTVIETEAPFTTITERPPLVQFNLKVDLPSSDANLRGALFTQARQLRHATSSEFLDTVIYVADPAHRAFLITQEASTNPKFNAGLSTAIANFRALKAMGIDPVELFSNSDRSDPETAAYWSLIAQYEAKVKPNGQVDSDSIALVNNGVGQGVDSAKAQQFNAALVLAVNGYSTNFYRAEGFDSLANVTLPDGNSISIPEVLAETWNISNPDDIYAQAVADSWQNYLKTGNLEIQITRGTITTQLNLTSDQIPGLKLLLGRVDSRASNLKDSQVVAIMLNRFVATSIDTLDGRVNRVFTNEERDLLPDQMAALKSLQDLSERSLNQLNISLPNSTTSSFLTSQVLFNQRSLDRLLSVGGVAGLLATVPSGNFSVGFNLQNNNLFSGNTTGAVTNDGMFMQNGYTIFSGSNTNNGGLPLTGTEMAQVAKPIFSLFGSPISLGIGLDRQYNIQESVSVTQFGISAVGLDNQPFHLKVSDLNDLGDRLSKIQGTDINLRLPRLEATRLALVEQIKAENETIKDKLSRGIQLTPEESSRLVTNEAQMSFLLNTPNSAENLIDARIVASNETRYFGVPLNDDQVTFSGGLNLTEIKQDYSRMDRTSYGGNGFYQTIAAVDSAIFKRSMGNARGGAFAQALTQYKISRIDRGGVQSSGTIQIADLRANVPLPAGYVYQQISSDMYASEVGPNVLTVADQKGNGSIEITNTVSNRNVIVVRDTTSGKIINAFPTSGCPQPVPPPDNSASVSAQIEGQRIVKIGCIGGLCQPPKDVPGVSFYMTPDLASLRLQNIVTRAAATQERGYEGGAQITNDLAQRLSNLSRTASQDLMNLVGDQTLSSSAKIEKLQNMGMEIDQSQLTAIQARLADPNNSYVTVFKIDEAVLEQIDSRGGGLSVGPFGAGFQIVSEYKLQALIKAHGGFVTTTTKMIDGKSIPCLEFTIGTQGKAKIHSKDTFDFFLSFIPQVPKPEKPKTEKPVEPKPPEVKPPTSQNPPPAGQPPVQPPVDPTKAPTGGMGTGTVPQPTPVAAPPAPNVPPTSPFASPSVAPSAPVISSPSVPSIGAPGPGALPGLPPAPTTGLGSFPGGVPAPAPVVPGLPPGVTPTGVFATPPVGGGVLNPGIPALKVPGGGF